MSDWHRSSSVVLVLLILGGCGSFTDNLPREPIAGTVIFAGEPLKKGSIQFVPTSPSAVAARSMILEGKFNIPRADGPVPGSYKVLIFAEGDSDTSSAEGDRSRKVQDKQAKGGEGLIPPKYNIKSELAREVKPGGDNHYEFILEK